MALLTITDIIKLRDEPIAGLLSETANYFPIVRDMPALAVPGTNVVNVPLETTLMSGEFRTQNTGRTENAPGLSTIAVSMKFFDASWKLDAQVAQSNWNGVENSIALMAANALKGAMQGMEKQILYGGLTGYTSGFDGLAKLIPQAMTVFAGGSASALSRVFIISKERGTKLLIGQDGQFSKSEVLYAPIATSAGTQYWGYSQALSMWGGLVVSNVSAAQIAGIDNGSNKLSDDLIFDALAKFPAGSGAQAIYMSRRSLAQLQKSRTSYSPTGAPAVLPTEVAGIPIFVTDSISDAETTPGYGASSSSSSSST